ncbi:MAG: aldehyde dehydrogenase [Kofleriaceae bacterium]|nr:aldehyde dehydrogenase [Kofleriaceae bacterium]MCL4222851.1 aldehyde dehydrogenase family protein [Myxococcales bacterium]
MAQLVSTDPATGAVVGAVDVTPADQVPAVVARARAAAPAWAALGTAGRAARLRPLAAAITARADELARLLTREMGKPLRDAAGEIRSVADGVDHELAEIEAALAPEELDDGRTRSTIFHDPLGVCAAITPWNFPFAMPHWMAFPALAAGNTVVLKPSEETPLIAQAYAELVRALVPDGVLQVVHGADEQGKALVAADVDLIAFTGSRAVGKQIMAAAAGGLKRIILELGGKDPLIVLDSADVDKAATFAARNCFRNAGQVCVATERIYVARPLAERFVSRLAVEADKLTVGNGLDDGTRIGPLVSARQRDHVLAQVGDALARGATLVRGGEHDGLFVQPTVLTGVSPDMAIAREETFGPVACVTVVDDADEAVALANGSRYGLGAVVFGADDDRTRQVARALDAGMIGVNQGVYGARGTPWVGARESGFAFHGSRDGHRNFTQTRVLSRPR